MGHGSTRSLPHSSIPPLYQHLHHITTTNTNPRLNLPIAIAWVHVKSKVILQYTHWLTFRHRSHFRDIPLIEGAVEGGSKAEHCRKKRKPITFTAKRARKERRKEEPWSKYCDSPKKANILWYHSTDPNPRVSPLETQLHVQIPLFCLQTCVTFTQTLLSPNAHALSSTTTQHSFPANEPPNLHTKPHNVQ